MKKLSANNPRLAWAIIIGVVLLVILAVVGVLLPPMLNSTAVIEPPTFTKVAVVQNTPIPDVMQTQTLEAAQTLTMLPPTITPTPLQVDYDYHDGNSKWTIRAQDFDGVSMVLVPPGCVMMGSTLEGDELPENQQCVNTSFWLDKYEVTQAQFKRLGGVKAHANGYEGDNRPVEEITWFEARDFCALRGGRLPTELEWEFAARGPDNLIYPWGNDWDANKVVSNRDHSQGTADVGSLPAGASWVGALDMSGNVWEWVNTLFKLYPYDTREVDTGNDPNVVRGLRGGSWDFDDAVTFRGADRYRNTPITINSSIGFRCAQSS